MKKLYNMAAAMTCSGVVLRAICFMFLAGCSWFEKPTEPQQATPQASIDASDGDYSDRIVITWDSIPGAVLYSVLRSAHRDSAFSAIAQHIDSFSCIDNSVSAGTSFYYKIAAYNSSQAAIDSTSYDRGFASLAGALPAPGAITAGDGVLNDGVAISWDAVEGAAYYKVFRCRTMVGDFIHEGGDAVETDFKDVSAGPGPYYYTVSAYTPTDIEGAHSDVDRGYRAITNLEFFHQCDTTVMRSNAKITKLGDFGEEMVAGDISGTCHYKTDVPGPGKALATITYTNYADYYLVLDGSYVSDTDWGGNGSMSGTLNITGIYKGSIGYHLTLKDKDANGGYYHVCQDGGSCEDIQYTSVK